MGTWYFLLGRFVNGKRYMPYDGTIELMMIISCPLAHNYSQSMFGLYSFKKKFHLKLLKMSACTVDIVRDNLATYDKNPEMSVWVFVCA